MAPSLEVLRIQSLNKAYGPRPVLEQITVHLNRGERAALVGENGAGKTTLARLLLGQERPDRGSVWLAPGVQLGYLPQEFTPSPQEAQQSLSDFLSATQGPLDSLRARLAALEESLAAPLPPQELSPLLDSYGDLQAEFEARGGYEADTRAAQVLSGLGLDYLPPQTPLGHLSGGEKTRLGLAALLLRAPDLLILDEPTNHLDESALAWLEAYLADYPHAALLISHDRAFIQATAGQIWELSAQSHQLRVYKGRYADYLAQREQMIAQAEAAFYEQKAEMRRLQSYIRQKAFSPKKAPPPSDGDKLLYNAKAATHERTVSKQLREAKHRLGDLQENPLSHPDRLWRVRLDFQPDPLPSQEALRLAGLSKAYGERVLFQNITLSLRRGERVALVGPNGAGKSTLLRIILGLEAADSGRVDWAPQAKPGYLAQDNRDLDPTQTVLAAYAAALPKEKSEAEMLADLHRGGLFSTDLLDGKLAGDLSLGQGRKLGLARLIGARANVLLLDEPSNHLDFTALEALEAALQSFTGAVLLASHDRWLIERVATRRWCLGEGGIIEEEL